MIKLLLIHQAVDVIYGVFYFVPCKKSKNLLHVHIYFYNIF